VAGGIVTRTPHSQPTRAGRTLVRRVFNDQVVQLVNAMKAVHLEDEDTTSLGVPTAPFEAIELEEALKEDAPKWLEAIYAKGTALKKLNTFTIMRGKIPNGRKVITSHWVLKKKFKANCSIARRKAQLVARGFEQVASLNYFATFASVIRYTTLRILLVKVAAKDLEADYVDINTAFLNPDLEEEIYMEVPRFLEEIFPELTGATDAYLKLNKALYGLKQAPRAWFLIVKKFFADLGL
jgi:hypothetical protein